MGDWIRIAVWGLLSGLRSRRDLTLENVALRHQLIVLPRRQALVLVEPATVVGWHRRGFRAHWRWKSRPKGGRPQIDPSVRRLIRHMWRSNPTWGAPRIQAELHKLGIDVSDSTVRRYRPGRPRQASQNWRSFLARHLGDIAAMDFFVVPTATFRVLYVLRDHGARPTQDLALQRHDVTQRCLDCPTTHRGVPLRHPASIPTSRPGQVLRRGRRPSSAVVGRRGSADRAGIPMAERLLRTPDRLHPSGVPRPRRRAQRTPSPTGASELRILLPRFADPPCIGWRLPWWPSR